MQTPNEISQNLVVEHLIKVLTCEICLCVMNNPRHLDCQHSFCSECISTMLSSKGYGDIDTGKYITCPICWEITLINEDSIYNFLKKIPKNYQLEQMCDLIRNSSAILDNNFEGSSPCSYNNVDGHFINEDRFKYCKLHKKNLLKYFCKTCDTLLCRVCEILDHRDHTIMDINNIYKEQEKLMIDLLESNKNNQIILKNSIKQIDTTINNLKQCEQDILTSINKSITDRINEIKTMGDELKNQLFKCIRLKTKKLDVQKDLLEMELGKMVFMDSFVNATLKNDDTIKTLSIKYHLKKICNEFQKFQLEPEEDDSIIYEQNPQPLSNNNVIGMIKVFSTYAELSFATGDGIKSAIVNEQQSFKVITMDRFGNSVAVNKNLQINIKSPNNHVLNTDISIKDNHDGSFLVNYTPKIIGKHTIEITIGDTAINGSPFIADVFSKRNYDLNQTLPLQKIGMYGTKFKEFKSPLGITSNDKQEIYICDSYNHRIQVLGGKGEHLCAFGSHGQKIGLFSCPSGIHINSNGSMIIVSELTNHRVQLFVRESIPSTTDKEMFVLKPKGCYGKEGYTHGCFRSPMGVCMSNLAEKFFVCDRDNSRIQYMTTEGRYISSLTSNLDKSFQPVYVCGEPYSNRIFVTDPKNNVIVTYDPRCGPKHISIISHLENSHINSLNQPKGISFDLSGNLIVSDSGNSRVLALKSDGNVIAEFPPIKNSNLNFFKSPEDITILPCGKIVTTDTLNHQIVIF